MVLAFLVIIVMAAIKYCNSAKTADELEKIKRSETLIAH